MPFSAFFRRPPLRLGLLLVFLTLGAPGAPAQLPGASPASSAMGHAYTALARGAGGMGVNPAGLAMEGTPAWSLVVPGAALGTGMDPVTLADLADFSGRTVPRKVRLEWLDRITGQGSQRGRIEAEVTGLAGSWGPWGVQVSGMAGGEVELNPDAAELLLFGNAGRTGEPRELELRGSRMTGFAVTTVGVSRALEVSRGPRGTFAVGATLGVSVGHALLVGRDGGSLIEDDPVEVELQLPVVHQSSDGGFGRGAGVGLDVAGAWTRGRWSAGAVVKNLFHTFEWDTDELVFRPGQALFDVEEVDSDFDERPFEQAPLELKRRVDELTFRPRIHLGVGYRATESLTVTGEIQRGLVDEGLSVGPRTRLTAGAEYRRSRFSLRGGGGYVTDGWTVAGGVGVRLGPATLEAGGLIRGGEAGELEAWTVALGFTPRAGARRKGT